MNLGDLNDTAAREIRAEMARQSRTQGQLAADLGCSQAYLSRRLRGESPLSLQDIEAIARALHISVLQLVWPQQVTSLQGRKGER